MTTESRADPPLAQCAGGAVAAPRAMWRARPLLDGWRLLAGAMAVFVLVPLSVVLFAFLSPRNDVWDHVVENLLADLLVNTAWLAAGVGIGTFVLGVSLAWLTAVCDFPGRRLFSWALLLPLALPAYVLAFVAIGLLEFTGPVQTALRSLTGAEKPWFPPIRSRGGVIAVLTLALYPYVYLLARNAFLTQGKRAIEAAQSLGHSQVSGFFRVALPMARPWIAGGLMLVLMETLADFGAVAVFNYDTFTTAIYKAWFSLFSLTTASQLASLLILIVFGVILIEQQMRAGRRYHQSGKQLSRERIPLAGPRRWLATAYAGTVLALAFVIPVAQMVLWALRNWASDLDQRYLALLGHTLLLGALAAALTLVLGLLLAYAQRRHRDVYTRAAVRIATLGYAVPGTVLAVGVFIPIAWIDNHFSIPVQQLFGVEARPWLQGTLFAMLMALLSRFLAVGFNPVDGAMQRITRSIDEASRSLGLSSLQMLRRIHVPMLRSGLLTGAVLVFVDVVKEMPITLMTRPFGWDTLAVRIFELTSEGEWERAALPAVALVLAGLVPIIILTRQAER